MQAIQYFKDWLKSNTNKKLSSKYAVSHILKEVITSYEYLLEYDNKSIHIIPATLKVSIPAIRFDNAKNVEAEPAVTGANVSSISV